ncbi:branched-chain amino acid ABC transporter substrate-binding protein [Dictyobacter aurantiacus]|nr:ABC transporter substrate-binding protein [Dictyobacter aurantiacus]
MSSQNDAGHDPMEDVFMHVMCDRWAEKLEVTRVEHLSEEDRHAFDLHMQSCPRCQELVEQYRVVDDYFYRLILSEQMSVAAKSPPLSTTAASKRQARHVRDTFHDLFGRRMSAFQQTFSLLLQGSGLLLLILILGALFFQVEIGGNHMLPLALLTLAFALIMLGFLNNQQQLRDASQQWRRSEQQHNTLAWREVSLPMPAMGNDGPAELSPRSRAQQRWRHRFLRDKWIWGVTVCLLLAITVASLGWFSPSPHPADIGGTVPSGAPVGISVDGSRVFDTNRQDGDLKRQAASKLLQGDVDGAKELWKQALALDSNDAELLIYQENMNVKESLQPYFTLVVGSVFSEQHIGGARDILQGAYVAQKEYNARATQEHLPQLRLMIASADVDASSPTTTAEEVVQAAQKDHSILGVIGWSTSRSVLSSLQELTAAHLPMVSPTATSDELSGSSPYFFRVAPPDTQQATLAATYAKQVLHAQRVVLLTDPDDTYSNSLAQAFIQHYKDGSHNLIHAPYYYTKGDLSTVDRQMDDILQQKPDLIYFAGYVNEASVMLKRLPPCVAGQPCLSVLGGDALYVEGDYSLDAFKNYGRLSFTAFASQERSQAQHPQFFADYAHDFDPAGQYRPGTYGYNATDADVILGYDATQSLLTAYQQLQASGQKKITGEQIQRFLHSITINGVSGKIQFDHNGNPIGKEIVILKGNENGHTTIDHSLDALK